MDLISIIAVTYAAACVAVMGFQVALIAGAPWGSITQGGQHKGALPRSGRIVALVSIFVLAGMAGGVLSAAGIWPLWPRWTAWVALALQTMVTILNWITPSRPERRLWGPVATVLQALASIAVLAPSSVGPFYR